MTVLPCLILVVIGGWIAFATRGTSTPHSISGGSAAGYLLLFTGIGGLLLTLR